MDSHVFHVETPLIKSYELSLKNSNPEHSTNVYFKLDNLQPSGSFKIRGIGNMIAQKFKTGEAKQIVASSGGELIDFIVLIEVDFFVNNRFRILCR